MAELHNYRVTESESGRSISGDSELGTGISGLGLGVGWSGLG